MLRRVLPSIVSSVLGAVLLASCGPVVADRPSGPTAAPTAQPTSVPTAAPTAGSAHGNDQSVLGWYGLVGGSDEGDEVIDHLMLLPEGTGQVPIRPSDDGAAAQIEALRDTGVPAHLSGTLATDGSEEGTLLLWVDRVRIEGPGPLEEASVEGWEGIVVGTPGGAQFNDYFQLAGQFAVRYGIESSDADTAAQLDTVRDTLTPVQVWGTLRCGGIDVNGCQLDVTRLRLVGEPLAPTPTHQSNEAEVQPVEGWTGTIVDLPAGNQFGQIFERQNGEEYHLGISNEDVKEQIAQAGSQEAQVRIWGTLYSGVPAGEARTIVVGRVESVSPPAGEGEPVEGWVGTIEDLPPGNQFGQFFRRDDGEEYDLGTPTDAVRQQVVEARGTGARVRVWGTLYTGIPAGQARTIELERVEILSQPQDDGVTVEGWTGSIQKLPPGNQFGQRFVRDDGEVYDIGTSDGTIQERIARAAWAGAHVLVRGQLFTGVPASEARHVEVNGLEILSEAAPEARDLTPFAAVTASSHLPADRYGVYGPFAAIDGAYETAWVEGAEGPGLDEWIELSFPGPFELRAVALDVGFDKSADLFAKNNRVKRVTLVFDSGERTTVDLEDTRGLQHVALVRAPGPNVETTSVRVIIDQVYPGTKYDDTCLAEIQVWGVTQ